jgi:hypothetical protein
MQLPSKISVSSSFPAWRPSAFSGILQEFKEAVSGGPSGIEAFRAPVAAGGSGLFRDFKIRNDPGIDFFRFT